MPVELREVGYLRYVRLSPDHIGLVLLHSLDCDYGVRIWSEDAMTVHEDEPTRYSDIYVYSWCVEAPDSPSNIP